MRENIDLNRFREFGDVISDTFIVIRQNFKPLLGACLVICGLFVIANILISVVINTTRGDSETFTAMWFAEMLLGLVSFSALLLVTLSYLALYKEKGNQKPDVIEVWGYFRYYFFRVFFTMILITIALTIGFFLCFIPFVYLVVVFALIVPIMVFENGSLEYSYKKAFKMIKGNWWNTFGIMLLVTVLIVVAMVVLMLPPIIIYGGGQWLTGKSLDNTAAVLQAVVINLCQLLWVVPFISSALIYFSIIENKEAGSLVERIKMFGRNVQGNDQISEQY